MECVKKVILVLSVSLFVTVSCEYESCSGTKGCSYFLCVWSFLASEELCSEEIDENPAIGALYFCDKVSSALTDFDSSV